MGEQGVEKVVLVFDGVVQFPAKFAHVIDPHRVDRRHADDDIPAAQPWKCLIRQVA